VHFTVAAPATVKPGDSFVVDLYAHLARQRPAVMRRVREEYGSRAMGVKSKGPVELARGAVLQVRLDMEGMQVAQPDDTLMWQGEIGNADFAVQAPQDARQGPRQGLLTVRCEGLQIMRIHFCVAVAATTAQPADLPIRVQRHRRAFASYASADRDAVLARVHGMQKAAPDLDVFLDVLSLRSGEDWQKKLWDVIPQNDVFYLFWSASARKSRWVTREWKCALKAKGLQFIDPVPLASPEAAPPPHELSGLHFYDPVLAFMGRSAP
jgi:hypothetical protein